MRRINLVVVDLAGSDNRQAVNGHLLRRHRAPPALPVGFAVRAFDDAAPPARPTPPNARGDVPPQRLVSTSSATTVHFGGFLNSPDPGKMEKRALRAPVNSCLSASFIPMCDSRLVSSAV